MGALRIFDQTVPVKDYYCSAFDEDFYQPMREPKLWLYINITDRCNGACRFCVNHSNGNAGTGVACVDPIKLSSVLSDLRPHLSGVSLTGGEPTLAGDTFAEVLRIVREMVPLNIMLNLAANGTGIETLQRQGLYDAFSTIHISRHAVSDEENRRIMGFDAPTAEDLKDLLAHAEDPEIAGVAGGQRADRPGAADGRTPAGRPQERASAADGGGRADRGGGPPGSSRRRRW